jgi:acyl-CoA thioester hydrolase
MLINFNNLDGKIIDNKHYYPVKIFYEDTDAGGIVYHSNYLKFFERARTSLLNLLKIDQLNIKKQDDIILVVRKADITWNKPAKLNDTLLIETCLKYAKNSSITLNQVAFKYDNNNHEHELLVSGVIQIVAINSQNKVRRMNTILNHKFFQHKS